MTAFLLLLLCVVLQILIAAGLGLYLLGSYWKKRRGIAHPPPDGKDSNP